MTYFDHFFIVYTGFIIGLLCGLFPIIISIYNYFEDEFKIQMKDYKDKLYGNVKISSAEAAKVNEKDSEEAANIQDKYSKQNRKLRRKQKRQAFIYNPKNLFWLILTSYLLSLILILIDILIRDSLIKLKSDNQHIISIFLIILSILSFIIGTVTITFIAIKCLDLIRKTIKR